MTRQAVREYAEERGWLNGDEEHDRRMVTRLWFHFNVVAA